MRKVNRGQVGRRAGAFTLLEMLAVIGIVVLLLGMAVVGLNAARNAAGNVATQQFLNSVSMAMAEYEGDFDAYPPSYWEDLDRPSFGIDDAAVFENWSGAEIMAAALVGPRNDDGMSGMGYTQRGREYGPYMELNSSQSLHYMGNDDAPIVAGATDGPDGRWGMRPDTASWPILYYKANAQGGRQPFDGNEDSWVWGPDGRFNTFDNTLLLEQIDDVASGGNPGDAEHENTYYRRPFGPGDLSDAGMIPAYSWSLRSDSDRRGFATTLRSAEFLLVAPGSDNVYGTEDDITTAGP